MAIALYYILGQWAWRYCIKVTVGMSLLISSMQTFAVALNIEQLSWHAAVELVLTL